MAPSQNYVLNSVSLEPLSRTYQYRKIMKPMLERKRRARINRCLDELKELMAVALQSEGENLTKLEKADILELTVRHLQSLKEKNALYTKPAAKTTEYMNVDSFWEGFRHCANEVSQYLLRFDQKAGINFLRHIKNYMPTQNLCTNTNTKNLLQYISENAQNVNGQQHYTRFPTSSSTSSSSSLSLSSSSSLSSTTTPSSSSLPLSSSNAFLMNSCRYHQEIIKYNNKFYENNAPSIDSYRLQNINSSITSNRTSISNLSIDDDSTVWRPW